MKQLEFSDISLNGISPSQREKIGQLFYQSCLSLGIDCREQAILFELKNMNILKVIYPTITFDIYSSDYLIGKLSLSFFIKSDSFNNDIRYNPLIEFEFSNQLFLKFDSIYYNKFLINYIVSASVNYSKKLNLSFLNIKYSMNSKNNHYNQLLIHMNRESFGNINNAMNIKFSPNAILPELTNLHWPKGIIEPNNIFMYLLFHNQPDMFHELFPEIKDYKCTSYSKGTITDEDSRIGLAESILI